MLMLDCKNTAPCYYPHICPDQLQFSPEYRVNARKDLEDGYLRPHQEGCYCQGAEGPEEPHGVDPHRR